MACVQEEAAHTLEVELAQVRAEATDRLNQQIAETEARRAAELAAAQLAAEEDAERALQVKLVRVQAASEARLEGEIAKAHAEAERVRNEREAALVDAQLDQDTLAQVLAQIDRESAEALETEIYRLQQVAETLLHAELARVRQEADGAKQVQAQTTGDAEQLHEAHAREARTAAEAASTAALEQEVARVRQEVESRLMAELEAVRAEAEAARLAQHQAHLDTQALRETATREARAAETAEARQSLESEVARVQFEADSRLDAELARVRQEVEHQRHADQSEAAQALAGAESRARVEAKAIFQSELAHVQAEAEARLADKLREAEAEAEQRREGEFAEMRAQLAMVNEAAHERARKATAGAVGLEVSRSANRISEVVATASTAYERTRASAATPTPLSFPRSALLHLRQRMPRHRVVRWSRAAAIFLVVGGGLATAGPSLLEATSAMVRSQADGTGFWPSEGRSPDVALAATVGSLFVESLPEAADLFLDGELRGVTPVLVDGLEPGSYTMTIESSAGMVQRTIDIQAGERTMASETITPGLLRVVSRIPLDLFLGGRRIGTTGDSQIMLPPGRHTLEVVNERYTYRDQLTVTLQPGDVATHTVSLPDGLLHVTTVDGAEVWVENELQGTAPLGNLAVPIGTRSVLVRHNTLGEQRLGVEVQHGNVTEVAVNLGPTRTTAEAFPLPPLAARTPTSIR